MLQPSWQIFNTGSPNTLIVVDVVSKKVIWAAGGGLDGPNDGTVVRTVNGGQYWKIVTPPTERRTCSGTLRRSTQIMPSCLRVIPVTTAIIISSKPSRISLTADGG